MISSAKHSLRRAAASRSLRHVIQRKFSSVFDQESVIRMHYDFWQQDPHHRYFGKTKEEIKETWAEAETEGKLLHAAIEAYFTRTPIDYDTERKEWKQFQDFHSTRSLTQCEYFVELPVWSHDLERNLRIDFVAKNSDGTYSIYDWKRSRNPICKDTKNQSYLDCSTQINNYRKALEEVGCQVHSMYVVRFHPEAESYEVTEVDRLEKETQAILNCPSLRDIVFRLLEENTANQIKGYNIQRPVQHYDATRSP